MKNHKFMFLAFVFCAFGILVCTSCKEKAPTEPTQTPQVQVPDTDVPSDTQELNFGSDELSEELKTLFSDGYFFSFEKKPNRITNHASRVQMYSDTGDLGEFGLISAPLQIDDEGVSPALAVVWLYEGEQNLRVGADKALELAYGNVPFERNEAFASFIPQKELELNGVTLKDDYPYSVTEKFKEYKEKHFVVFVWKDRKLYYAFIVR